MNDSAGKVLIIDDNEVIRRLALTLLSKRGYTAEAASSGPEGIQLTRAFNPHVILLDVMMPDMDGFEVCHILKSDDTTKDIPIIMVTSKAQTIDKVKGLELGAADYVEKPFDHEELQARVATQVKIKKLWDELQEKNKMLQELLKKDGLTDLYNHRHFQERIAEEYLRAKRYDLSLSCIFIDIDYFKKINDTHGHQAGDAILKQLAAVVTENLRDVDIAARYGGEEFVLILPHTPQENAKVLGERLRHKIETACFEFKGTRIPVTVSLGVASLPENAPSSHAELINFADAALYAAKHSGRNRIELYQG